jgi:hypothetical protein
MEKHPETSEAQRQVYRRLRNMCQFFFLLNSPRVVTNEYGDKQVMFTLNAETPESHWVSVSQHVEDPLQVDYIIQTHHQEQTTQYELYINELVRLEADSNVHQYITILRRDHAVFGAVTKHGNRLVPRRRSSQTNRSDSGELSVERAQALTAELFELQQTFTQE